MMGISQALKILFMTLMIPGNGILSAPQEETDQYWTNLTCKKREHHHHDLNLTEGFLFCRKSQLGLHRFQLWVYVIRNFKSIGESSVIVTGYHSAIFLGSGRDSLPGFR